jgi:hypothetical protein
VDITHQCEGKYQIHKTGNPHEERELEEPGYKANQKRSTHRKIQTPSDNLHIHDYHIRFVIFRQWDKKVMGRKSRLTRILKRILSRVFC